MELDARIKKLIRSKGKWTSSELLDAIENMDEATSITLHYFEESGWRTDVVYTETVHNTDELKKALRDRNIPFNDDITDLTELAETVEEKWLDHYQNIGGNGWIEYA